MRLSFFLTLIVLLGTGSLKAEPAFAQLSSLNSQVPATKGSAKVFIDSIDAISNIDLAPDEQSIVIKEDGYYFMIANLQGGSVTQTSTGFIDAWITLNGKSMPGTNCRITIDEPTSTQLLLTQSIVHLAKGDAINITYGTSGPSLGLIFRQPAAEPAIPSFTFSIFKVSPP